MAEISKNPLDLADSILKSNAIIGSIVDVPHHPGVQGKIIDEIGDTYGIEYTTPPRGNQGGVTRQDRFYKHEYKLPSQEGNPTSVDLSTFHPGNGLTNEEERQIIEKLRDLNSNQLNDPKGLRNILGGDTAINQLNDEDLDNLIKVAIKWRENYNPRGGNK